MLCFRTLPTDVHNLNSTVGGQPPKDKWLEMNSLTPELEDVVGRIDWPLEGIIKTQLSKLPSDYRDIFALKGEPLARTGLVQHEIHTDSTAPIRQGHEELGGEMNI